MNKENVRKSTPEAGSQEEEFIRQFDGENIHLLNEDLKRQGANDPVEPLAILYQLFVAFSKEMSGRNINDPLMAQYMKTAYYLASKGVIEFTAHTTNSMSFKIMPEYEPAANETWPADAPTTKFLNT